MGKETNNQRTSPYLAPCPYPYSQPGFPPATTNNCYAPKSSRPLVCHISRLPVCSRTRVQDSFLSPARPVGGCFTSSRLKKRSLLTPHLSQVLFFVPAASNTSPPDLSFPQQSNYYFLLIGVCYAINVSNKRFF